VVLPLAVLTLIVCLVRAPHSDVMTSLTSLFVPVSQVHATTAASTTVLVRNEPFDMVLCTTVKNNERLLPEWIAFHRLQGVQHFYVYDDESDRVNYTAVLAPLIAAGVVELRNVLDVVRDPAAYIAASPYANETQWHANMIAQMDTCNQDRSADCPQCRCQSAMNMDCIARARMAKARWLASYDVDEFMFRPLLGNGDSPGPLWQALDDVAAKSPNVDVFVVDGLTMGVAGFPFKNWTGLMIETHRSRISLTETGAGDDPRCGGDEFRSWKSWSHPQGLKVDKGFVHMPESDPPDRFQWVGARVPSAPIRFFHYQLGSVEEMLEKAVINGNPGYYVAMATSPDKIACSSAVDDGAAARFAQRVGYCINHPNDRSRCDAA